MASNDTKLGTGLATGMFYHAPAGTALPSYPGETLPAAWKHIGDVTEDGIELANEKSVELLRNWAHVVKRAVAKDHTETIKSPIMDTTEESMKTVLGEANVAKVNATATHGKLLNVNLSAGDVPEAEAFLWLMKDGDDMMAIGCTRGQVTKVENVAFKPGEAVTWTPTITALGDGFKLIIDDGQKTGAGA